MFQVKYTYILSFYVNEIVFPKKEALVLIAASLGRNTLGILSGIQTLPQNSNYLINYLWNKMLGTTADPCVFIFFFQCGKYNCAQQKETCKLYFHSQHVHSFRQSLFISIVI